MDTIKSAENFISIIFPLNKFVIIKINKVEKSGFRSASK